MKSLIYFYFIRFDDSRKFSKICVVLFLVIVNFFCSSKKKNKIKIICWQNQSSKKKKKKTGKDVTHNHMINIT